jgi:O-acetyl-ADP-ribose deacetylase
LNRQDAKAPRVQVVIGDITQCTTESIVNSANTELWMGGGVAGAIKFAGGEAIEREAKSLAPIALGDAIITNAGTLPTKFVIHAATMPNGGQATSFSVKAAAASALELANDRGLKSIAIPALGTGAGECGLEDGARVICAAILEHCSRHEQPESIQVVVINEYYASVFRRALEK